MSRRSTQTTEQIFGRAVDLVAALRVDAEGPELADCVISIAYFAYISGQALKGLAQTQRGVCVIRRLGSRPLLRRALSLLGLLLAETGNLAGAMEAYAEALEISIDLGDQLAEGAVLNNLGIALLYAARYAESLLCLQRVVALSKSQPEDTESFPLVRASALTNIAIACLHVEDYARGLDSAKEAIDLLDNPSTACRRLARVNAEANYVRLLLQVDAADEARQRCEVARQIAHESGLERAEMEASIADGLCEVHSGMVDVGLSRLSRALDKARAQKGPLRQWPAPARSRRRDRRRGRPGPGRAADPAGPPTATCSCPAGPASGTEARDLPFPPAPSSSPACPAPATGHSPAPSRWCRAAASPGPAGR